MPNDACPLPDSPGDDEEKLIARLLQADRICVVGLSDDPSRTSHHIAQYLLSHGKRIVPVNPNVASVFGQKSFARLTDVPGEIELVDVFRRPEFCADVVRDAVAAGAKAVWLQSGIVSAEARNLALQAGIDYIEDRCLMVEHLRHARGRRAS